MSTVEQYQTMPFEQLIDRGTTVIERLPGEHRTQVKSIFDDLCRVAKATEDGSWEGPDPGSQISQLEQRSRTVIAAVPNDQRESLRPLFDALVTRAQAASRRP